MKKRFTEEQIIQILKEQKAGERTADVWVVSKVVSKIFRTFIFPWVAPVSIQALAS